MRLLRNDLGNWYTPYDAQMSAYTSQVCQATESVGFHETVAGYVCSGVLTIFLRRRLTRLTIEQFRET